MKTLTLEQAQKMMAVNGGDLDLAYTPIESLPEGLTVGGGLWLEGSKIKSLPKGLEVGGTLDLENTPIESLPEGLTVGWNLYLSGSKVKSLPKGLKVRGNLYLRNTPIESLPEGLTVGGGLYLGGSKIKSLPQDLKVGGDLNLAYTPIESLPEGLKVRGHLDLANTPIEALPEGLVVGGYLWLRGSKVATLPDGITVCGDIYTDFDYDETKVHRPKDGEVFQKDGHTFIFVDGILTVVKSIHKVGGYTFYKGNLPWNNVITDGEEFAHCKNIRDGIADLAFKKAKNRGQCQYKDVSLDDEFTVPELVVMYRIITGACKAGSEAFVSSLGELKERYSVREAIEITEGQYNAGAFAQFFGQ